MEKGKVMPTFKLVVIGGSAGSLEVLLGILPRLNPMPNHAVVIVLHRKTSEDSTLEELLALKSSIPLVDVEDKTMLTAGSIFVAPSGYHLLFEKNGELSLDASEKIHYSRPSIDVAFESASEAFGQNTTAILLSGANADGAAGVQVVKQAGGIIVVQDPETAEMPYMPASAIEKIIPDYIYKPQQLLEFINSL